MVRKIIHIDGEKCTGCGLCADACHEGAIEMVDGKARLTKEDHCDGLGDCLPTCPAGAITFEEREAPAYDEKAARASKAEKARREDVHGEGGCPGSKMRVMDRQLPSAEEPAPAVQGLALSRLGQWPCQIKLVPETAPFFSGAKLLIAADCTAYAYASVHEDFMKGRVTLIGCPKLDGVDYSEKLTCILAGNEIRSVTVLRMEVPCCGGLEFAAKKALQASEKLIPWKVVTISIDGRILEET